MPPRTPAGQGRIAFGVAPGSDAAAAAGAIIDVDDQNDEAVLVAEQQKQQKEKTQPVLFTKERPRDVGIGKVSCVFKDTMKTKGEMVKGDHVVHCFLLHRPSNRGTKLLFKVIKAIIIMNLKCRRMVWMHS